MRRTTVLYPSVDFIAFDIAASP